MSCYHLNAFDDIIISDLPSGNLAWPCENTIYVYKSSINGPISIALLNYGRVVS